MTTDTLRAPEHDLKTWPEPFAAILAGTKRHEIRKADRPFAVGDVLLLREWAPSLMPHDRTGRATEVLFGGPMGYYTGRSVRVTVTHLTHGGAWGLPADLCVMSVALPRPRRSSRWPSDRDPGERGAL